MAEAWDLVVVGGGPGGYVAALRAARLGLKVACVDRGALPGGTCLHYGCIPSKSLLADAWRHDSANLAGEERLAAMMTRKSEVVQGLAQGIVGLFKKYRVTWIRGTARVSQPGQVVVQEHDGAAQTLDCRHILLALGSRSRTLPGIAVDGERILDSTHALSLQRLPHRLAVMGGGAIGLEMGSLFTRLGSRVTLVEAMAEILPGNDDTIVRHGKRLLQKQGLTFRTACTIEKIQPHPDHLTLAMAGHDPLEVDALLVAVGREANSAGVESLALAKDHQGRLLVDERYQTSLSGIHALGDVTPGPMLAHRAMAEGVRFAELLAGHPRAAPVTPIPHVVYTHPEIAGVGLTEARAKQQYGSVRTGQAFFMANPRARCTHEAEGVVKVVATADGARILGVHMVGAGVAELVATGVAALQNHWDCRQLGGVIFPHPSLGETLKEAALAVVGEAIHA